LSLKFSHFSLDIVKKLFQFGVYFSFLNTMRTLTSQIGTLIVGHGLSNRTVATFSIARQLIVYSNNFIVSVTQVATARAAVLYFGEQIDRQRALFIDGGRYAMALSCFFAIGFFALGSPFLTVWQGGRQNDAYLPLLILTVGEIIPMSQWVTFGVVISMGKHRLLGAFAVLEGVVILILASVLVGPFGIVGVCVAIAFAGFVFRGVCQWLYGCRLLEISPLSYVRKTFLPVLIPSVILFGLFSLLRVWSVPNSWPQLVLAGAIYSLTYILLLTPFLFSWRVLTQFARILLRRIQSREA
jgi:O-antigen/teichoic acid export membrane protein